MKNPIKILINIFEDKRGFLPALAAGAIIGGGLLSAAGKPKQRTIDPLSDLRKKTGDFLGGRLGQTTGFNLNPAFEQQQPGIETAAEKSILGRFSDPITAQGITSDITRKAFDAQRERQKELFDEERQATANRFNRLGLVSSSPGLKAQSDIDERQRISAELLSSDLAAQEIASQLQALGLSENIRQGNVSQALGLGGIQRGAQVQAQAFSLQDLQRLINEQLGFSGLTSNFLTSQPSETFFEPSLLNRIGSAISGGGQAIQNFQLQKELLRRPQTQS